MNIAHLKLFSHYSMLEGIWTPKEYASYAADLEMTHLAITDIDGVYGAIEFYTSCKKADVTPIIGTTLSFVPNVQLKQKDEDLQQVTFLSTTNDGYHHMLELISLANLSAWHERARFDMDTLAQHHSDMYMLMWGLHSPIMSMLQHKQPLEAIAAFLKTFEAYIPVGYCLLWLLTQDESIKKVKMHNEAIHALAKMTWWKVVLLTEVQYVTATDKDLFDVWLAVKDGKRVFDDDRRKPIGKHHLMTYDEILKMMIDNDYTQMEVEKRAEQTNLVADSCKVDIALWWILFPKYENPAKISELYKKHKDELIVA